MDTTRYAAFAAAADTKSMSGAAKKLGYTPSGIVRLVNALEADLGFTVLVRTTSGVSLTPEGEKLLPVVREVLRYEERAEQTSARIRGQAAGSLRIGVQAGISPQWFPQMISDYQGAFPEMDFRIVEADKQQLSNLLLESELDCCLVHGRLDDCAWHPLATREVVAWVPALDSLARSGSLLLAELAERRVVVPACVAQSLSPSLVDRLGVSAGEPGVVSVSLASGMVACETSCAIVLDGLQAFGSDKICQLPLSPRRYVDFGIAALPGPSMSPAADEFFSFAVSFASGLPAVSREE